MMALHGMIRTMQFDIPEKEQNGLKHYLSININRQPVYDCSEIFFFSHQVEACLALVLKKLCQCKVVC